MPYPDRQFITLYYSMFVTLIPPKCFILGAKRGGGGMSSCVGLFYCFTTLWYCR